MEPTSDDLHARVHGLLQGVQRGYAADADDERPLAGYLALLGVFGGAVGVAGLAGRVRGAGLPQRWSAGDVALLALATHKASRLVAKDTVTSPLRAPFTRFTGPAGEGEVNEDVRGDGVRHAVGELVTCPLCLSVWVATGLVAAGALAPRATRAVTVVLTAVLGSDVLHLLYDAAKQLPRRARPED